ncbi:hypothetical protein Gotri_002682 [Gossypium trilobum]|uniref:DUF4283 domain-containing protein n=1 Tax=Gossypium trilobum TaxID=34281 RepID=A0A7J9F928_9ROSI|nr:hypothetical protein [Gossypium trilobum]
MDLDRVVNGALWIFNNHILVFRKLHVGEDPVKSVAKQLGDFDGEFLEYDSKSLPQSRRTAVVSSFWLREYGEEGTQGCNMERGNRESGRQGSGLKMDPILEANLDGDGSDNFGMVGNTFKIGGRNDMDHDGEENPIEGEEGKKRPRNDTENHKVAKVIDSLVPREDRPVGKNLFIPVVTKGHADRSQ